MGKLVYLSEFRPTHNQSIPNYNPQWYMLGTYYNYDSNCYSFKWPNDAFPGNVAIHADEFRDKTDLRIQIRKWIEMHLQETVIMDIVDKSYRKYYDENNKDWDHSYEVKNIWYIFSFEDTQSATAFALRFADEVSILTDTHPTRDT